MIDIKLPKQLPSLVDEETGKRNVSILKLSCNGKFCIFKTVNPSWLPDEIRKVYGKYIRPKVGVSETNLLYPFIKWLYKQTRQKVIIEVLFTSTNGYEVLKFELNQLIEHFGKPECLNANNVPHIPKTEVAKKGSGWLTQNEALNFRKLLTKYDYFSSFSIPINRRPVFLQATPVVPEPIQLSSTVSPSFV